jgi:hypothetical protein
MNWKRIFDKVFVLTLISLVGFALIIIVQHFGIKKIFNNEQIFILFFISFFISFIYEYKVERIKLAPKIFLLKELLEFSIISLWFIFITIILGFVVFRTISISYSFTELYFTFLYFILIIKTVKILRYLEKL